MMRALGANAFLIVAAIVFCLGLLGLVLNRRSLLRVLMSIELMLIGVTLNFIIFSVFLKDMVGQIFSLFVLTVAAAETAIGLALVLQYFSLRRNITVEDLHQLDDKPKDALLLNNKGAPVFSAGVASV